MKNKIEELESENVKLREALRGLSSKDIERIAKEATDETLIPNPKIEVDRPVRINIDFDTQKSYYEIKGAIRKAIERAFIVNKQIYELKEE